MSTIEPDEEGTTQPKRNKETTRSTTQCLQWAIGESIGQHLCRTDTQGEGQNGKPYCTLCAVWLSSKGAILKDHVLGKNKKGIGRCILLCLLLGFATFIAFGKLGTPTYGLKHAAACRSTAHFSWGPLVPGLTTSHHLAPAYCTRECPQEIHRELHHYAAQEQASFVRGVGVFWTRPTHPTLDPPTRLLTHPDPPPPLINLWGEFCEPN